MAEMDKHVDPALWPLVEAFPPIDLSADSLPSAFALRWWTCRSSPIPPPISTSVSSRCPRTRFAACSSSRNALPAGRCCTFMVAASSWAARRWMPPAISIWHVPPVASSCPWITALLPSIRIRRAWKIATPRWCGLRPTRNRLKLFPPVSVSSAKARAADWLRGLALMARDRKSVAGLPGSDLSHAGPARSFHRCGATRSTHRSLHTGHTHRTISPRRRMFSAQTWTRDHRGTCDGCLCPAPAFLGRGARSVRVRQLPQWASCCAPALRWKHHLYPGADHGFDRMFDTVGPDYARRPGCLHPAAPGLKMER